MGCSKSGSKREVYSYTSLPKETRKISSKQSNFTPKEFRVMIVKMIQNLGNRMEAQIEKIQERFDKDLEELKNKQTEMNNTIPDMKNTLEGINYRITEAEE